MKPTSDTPLREHLDFAETDTLLRDDVRRLGAMVGQMLADQGSQRLLDEVEGVRRAAIERRESGRPVDALADALAQVPTDDAEALVRAFAAYFGAINLAERVHRIRRRRDYQRAGDAPQPGGLEAVLRALKDDGVELDELQACLARLHIEPVFTAHPTEAIRRVLLEKERTIVERLIADIDRDRTPTERRADDARIVLALTSSWQTSEAPARKPTVGDEVEHVGYYLSNVLYRVLPVFYEALGDAIERVYGTRPALPQVLRFGTWVGGDMDGNPNVNADTMRAALGAQALAQYRRDLRALGNVLTQTLGRAGIDEAVLARVDAYRRSVPGAESVLNPRHADMPYRRLLDLMRARLAATDADHRAGYADAVEFVEDLRLIETSLRAHRGENAGLFALERLLWRARTFGFHLAALDLRQDSAVHDEVLGQLDGSDWTARDVEARVARLHAMLDAPPKPADAAAHDTVASTLGVFRAVLDLRRSHGAAATGLYIISMARSAADALAVLALARIAECTVDGEVPLDVAPLFETVDDLQAALRAIEMM